MTPRRQTFVFNLIVAAFVVASALLFMHASEPDRHPPGWCPSGRVENHWPCG